MLRRLLGEKCSHLDYAYLGREVTGATLSWSAKPTRQFTYNYTCLKCGKSKNETGMMAFGDEAIYPQFYDSSGWPLDESGSKLNINDSQ